MKKTFGVLTLMLLLGCGYNNTSLPAEDSGGPENQSAAVPVSFAAVRDQVLVPHCVRCHSSAGARAGINLETYATVKLVTAKLVGAVVSGSMPPRGGLPNDLRKLVSRWVQEGAPEVSLAAAGFMPMVEDRSQDFRDEH